MTFSLKPVSAEGCALLDPRFRGWVSHIWDPSAQAPVGWPSPAPGAAQQRELMAWHDWRYSSLQVQANKQVFKGPEGVPMVPEGGWETWVATFQALENGQMDRHTEHMVWTSPWVWALAKMITAEPLQTLMEQAPPAKVARAWWEQCLVGIQALDPIKPVVLKKRWDDDGNVQQEGYTIGVLVAAALDQHYRLLPAQLSWEQMLSREWVSRCNGAWSNELLDWQAEHGTVANLCRWLEVATEQRWRLSAATWDRAWQRLETHINEAHVDFCEWVSTSQLCSLEEFCEKHLDLRLAWLPALEAQRHAQRLDARWPAAAPVANRPRL